MFNQQHHLGIVFRYLRKNKFILNDNISIYVFSFCVRLSKISSHLGHTLFIQGFFYRTYIRQIVDSLSPSVCNVAGCAVFASSRLFSRYRKIYVLIEICWSKSLNVNLFRWTEWKRMLPECSVRTWEGIYFVSRPSGCHKSSERISQC